MSEERFNRLETKLDGVVADVAVLKTDVAELKTDVAVLKTDVRGLKADQTSMEERLVAQMRMLHEDTIDRLRTISEAQDAARELARERANRHFSLVLDNHEHRLTALEKSQPPP
jgi:FtsZ-binding cell division protein ZapB